MRHNHPTLTRRQMLGCCAGLAAGLFTALPMQAHAGFVPALGEGLSNPCSGPLPDALARNEWVQRAFEGLDVEALWDVHAHLLGTGDSGSGCSVHPALMQWWHPVEVLRRRGILDAACVPADAPSIDEAFIAQLQALARDFPAGARWLLFAFEQAHDDQGRAAPQWSTFHVPNRHAAAVAARAPHRFGWVASVHPYRDDAPAQLDACLRDGAVALKWLPSAMNIDLRDARCRPLYERLRATRTPLVVHCGEEKAVPGAGRDALGNPLLVRAALDAGVRVVVAHCASLGMADDLDRRSRAQAPAFDLFARLMDEPAYRDLLAGDLSAVFQVNRTPRVWRKVLQREDWHARLLHGSDHPLPGVMPLYSAQRLADAGLLDPDAVAPLHAVRSHNPLLFDFVLKRHLRAGHARLPSAVFETRRFFTSPRRASTTVARDTHARLQSPG